MVALLLLWAAPANAFSKQTGTRTMADGTSIAYDLYEPDGAAPSGGDCREQIVAIFKEVPP